MKTAVHARLIMTVVAMVMMSVWGAAVQSEPGSVLAAEREPIKAARFVISIDGVEVASFTQLDSFVDLSSANPTRLLTLTGGHSDGNELAAWHEAVLMGDIVAARKSCSID